MSLRTIIAASIDTRKVVAVDLGSTNLLQAVSAAITLTDGTTTGKADKAWSDTRTIALSSSEDLDLAGTLTDPYGATVTFVTIKAILIKAAAGNTNNVVVGAKGAGGFVGPFLANTCSVAIEPGQIFMITSKVGWPVGASSTDLLKIANSGAGTGVTYDVILVGCSA